MSVDSVVMFCSLQSGQ